MITKLQNNYFEYTPISIVTEDEDNYEDNETTGLVLNQRSTETLLDLNENRCNHIFPDWLPCL